MVDPIRSSMVLCALACTILCGSGTSYADDATQPEAQVTYERDVRPILKAHCFLCHGESEAPESGLDLRLKRLIVKGGDSGTAVIPGTLDESPIYSRIASGEMPPDAEDGEKVTPEELAVIARWISSGAPTTRPEPDDLDPNDYITEEERNFWSLQSITRPSVPGVTHADRVETPVDAFLLSKLEQHELSFSPEADERTLVRRAYFDLIGLPPTPREIEGFLADEAPDAYERLVDRLLASPHYGERWGRHWLDLAGYADSEGYTNTDPERQWAFRFRDYVIGSFNADKPFDRFVHEQLAGDEMVLPPYKNLAPEQIEMLAATGYLRMAPDGTGTSGVDQNIARNQVMAETIQIVTTSLMGLSVGCAQCHDHRYDPIPQSDYYRLRAVFEPAYDWKKWRAPAARNISLYTDADREQVKVVEAEAAKVDEQRKEKQDEYIQRTFEKELAKLPDELRETVRTARDTPEKERTDEQKTLLREHPSVNVSAGSLYLYDRKAADDLKAYSARAADIRARKPTQEFVRALTESPGAVPETFFFFRGDFNEPRQTLEPAGLTAVSATADETTIPLNDESMPSTGRRLAFAKRLTSGSHPLTARVIVNRVWTHHFGQGIVATPADFGSLGTRPTHPELLDWLADEFVRGDWHIKRLHRLLMLSAAYRQSSVHNAAHDTVDPDNHLYGRKNMTRLDAESLRDSILVASGRFNNQMLGPSVPVMENDVGQFVIGIDKKNGENRQTEHIPLNGQEYRRSVYVQVRRSRPVGMLDTFDAPRMEPNCEQRSSSTVAPQSLMLMNSDFVVGQSEDFARRVISEAGEDKTVHIVRAWEIALSKPPSPDDITRATTFIEAQTEHFSSDTKEEAAKKKSMPPYEQALATYCQALLSANRFLYID